MPGMKTQSGVSDMEYADKQKLCEVLGVGRENLEQYLSSAPDSEMRREFISMLFRKIDEKLPYDEAERLYVGMQEILEAEAIDAGE